MKKIITFTLFVSIIFIFPIICGNISRKNNSSFDIPFPFFTQKDISFEITYLDTKTNKINSIEIEDYLPGVVAAEMPVSFEIEALKAQAVAARSFIVSRISSPSKDHSNATVCNNPNHCKAYLSEDEVKSLWAAGERENYWSKIKKAVSSTSGEYMVHNNEVIEAFFFAGSNGRTENSEDVWGESRPYLKSVESPEDTSNPKLCSTEEFSLSDAYLRLSKANPDFKVSSAPFKISNIEYTEGKNIKSLTINETSFSGKEIRNIFGLKSSAFNISVQNNSVKFEVIGSGHGVGMSQYGANYMAQNGKKYTEILSHYYTNIQIIKL